MNMQPGTNSNAAGYIALMAILIIGAVAIAVGTALLVAGVDGQRSALVTQRSQQARSLATACAEEALQVIHDNTSYTGTANLSLGQGTCSYTVTNTGGNNRSIAIDGDVSVVKRRITVQLTISTTITITSWQESQ